MQAKAQSGGRKVKILIVDDDTPIAMVMVFLLTKANCDTRVASTGKKALEIASEEKFDLITLEIHLPDIDGFEIFNELKQRHFSRQTPIVFISEESDLENQQRGLELGAADCITKPLDADELAPRLLSHVKLPQAATVL